MFTKTKEYKILTKGNIIIYDKVFLKVTCSPKLSLELRLKGLYIIIIIIIIINIGIGSPVNGGISMMK